MKWAMFLVWAGMLNACGSSPIEQGAARDPADARSKYKLDFEEIMEFEQGRAGEYLISALVPPPGLPLLKAEGLPEGAVIEGLSLKYTPPCSLSLSAGKFYRGYISTRIRISLQSDQAPDSVIQKTGLMIVFRHDDEERPCGESSR